MEAGLLVLMRQWCAACCRRRRPALAHRHDRMPGPRHDRAHRKHVRMP
jgi:hypothetical protein